MDCYLIRNVEKLALEQLMKWPEGEKFQQTIQLIQSMQEHLAVLSEKDLEPSTTGVKAATILALAILRKTANGKRPASFDQEDWKELAQTVSECAILLEGEKYTIFVFQLYEKYIRASAASIQNIAPYETVEAISKLADELRGKETQFRNGGLSEGNYTEDCLWICLDAMIKLIASAAFMFCGRQTAEFAQALASCAFEYGRWMLYQKQQALAARFIESQYHLDEELEQKYVEYLSELETQSKQFYALIDHAFAPDFHTAFLHSILLANAAGAKKSDILSSAEEIDSFFLS